MSLILDGTNGLSDIDGSAATPAIRGTDANTGIFFPAADTVATSVAGTEGMRLTSTGLGIGTTSPSQKLHVYAASGSIRSLTETGNTSSSAFTAKNSGEAVDYGVDSTGGFIQVTGAKPLLFYTNSTERARIDSSGNLGIGTTSPAVRLNPAFDGTSGSTAELVRLTNGSGGGSGTGTSLTYYHSLNTGALVEGGRIAVVKEATWTTTASTQDANMQFWTTADGTAAERARIDSSGRLLAGTTSASNGSHTFNIANSSRMAFDNNGAAPFGLIVQYNSNLNGTSNEFLLCQENNSGGGTSRMVVRSNGGIANYSANNVNLSDRREKTNFAPATSYLDKICAIPVQTFNYIDQNLEEDGGLTLGVVAQDVQAVAPELVMESNWAGKDAEPKMRLSIYQTDLQYALMKCIQEQQAIIESQSVAIEALKARLDAANL